MTSVENDEENKAENAAENGPAKGNMDSQNQASSVAQDAIIGNNDQGVAERKQSEMLLVAGNLHF